MSGVKELKKRRRIPDKCITREELDLPSREVGTREVGGKERKYKLLTPPQWMELLVLLVCSFDSHCCCCLRFSSVSIIIFRCLVTMVGDRRGVKTDAAMADEFIIMGT